MHQTTPTLHRDTAWVGVRCGHRDRQPFLWLAVGAVVVALAAWAGWLAAWQRFSQLDTRQARVYDAVLYPEHHRAKCARRAQVVATSLDNAKKVAAERCLWEPGTFTVWPTTENYIDTLTMQINP